MRAVITGGSSGIGFATAQVLGREGYEIIVVSFDEKQQEPTLKALAEEGIKASYYLCDVTKEESVNETFARISEKADSVDLAGKCSWRPGRPALRSPICLPNLCGR